MNISPPKTYLDRAGQPPHPGCEHGGLDGCSCDLCVGATRCATCDRLVDDPDCGCFQAWMVNAQARDFLSWIRQDDDG